MSDPFALAERLQFLSIDPSLRQALRQAEPIVRRALPQVLDQFYAHVGHVPELAKMFSSKEHMAHAKQAQIRHWHVILNAQFDEAYVQSVHAIGRAHCRLGLEPRWYIGGYAMLVNGLIHAVIETSLAQGSKNWLGKRDDDVGPSVTQMVRALIMVSMLDMDMSISVYIDEGRKQRTEMIEHLGTSFQTVTDAIAATTQDLNATSQLLTRNADMTRELSLSAASGSEECSVTVSSVANAAVELGKAINEISRQVQDASQIALNAVSQANTTNHSMDELQARPRALVMWCSSLHRSLSRPIYWRLMRRLKRRVRANRDAVLPLSRKRSKRLRRKQKKLRPIFAIKSLLCKG